MSLTKIETQPKLLPFSAGEEIEEVFAEDYDDPAKDAEPGPETAGLAVNGDKKEKDSEEEESEEDNEMREVRCKAFKHIHYRTCPCNIQRNFSISN